MTLEAIKQAVDEGKTVHYSNDGYTVIGGKAGYFIAHANGSMIELTWADGVTMNGKEEAFYLEA